MVSNFIEEVYKKGKIKKYSDVCDNLESEELNFYIGEKIVKYPKYDIGDIIFVKNYKYKDNTSGNNHLFVIIDDDNRGISFNYFCMLISSKLDKEKYIDNIRLSKDDINNLSKNSIVKTDEIYSINHKEVSFMIGRVNLSLVKLYRNMYLNNEDLIYE